MGGFLPRRCPPKAPRWHKLSQLTSRSQCMGSFMRIAYFDCLSGISGDMTLGALVDCGADLEAINAAIGSLGLPDCRLVAREVKKHGFRATQVTVEYRPEHTHRHLADSADDRGQFAAARKTLRAESSAGSPSGNTFTARQSRKSTSTKSGRPIRLPTSLACRRAGLARRNALRPPPCRPVRADQDRPRRLQRARPAT